MLPRRSPSSRSDQGRILLAGALVAGAAVAAYAATLSAPFVFDSPLAIVNNPTIRHLGSALTPPHDGSPVEGRPLVNLSFAVNYAISGTRVWSYHAFNLFIHILSGWTLFGLIRRTMRAEGVRALAVALAAALIWTVHPLQTESVTYVAQRAESLAGLLYLLTLYGFVRGADRGWAWLAFSVVCCLLGTTAKEIVVSAPLIVFLYDRTFVSGSFSAAWRRRRGYYLALLATWIPLGCLVVGTGGRSGTAGLGTELRWFDYLLTQVYAVPHYLRLALWPRPLVFDYGRGTVPLNGGLILPGLVIIALLFGTGVALGARKAGGRAFGFLGVWFLAILAPTSLIPVATQTMAEHRMYLPLAAVVTTLALVLDRILIRPGTLFVVTCIAAGGLGAATVSRNRVYRSELALWQDTVAKQPGNDRAHNNLGNALFLAGRIPEALESYEIALRLHPQGDADAEYNLGNGYLQEGKLPQAIAHSAEAVRLAPANPEARNNLGMALDRSGHPQEAALRFQEAIALYQARLQADPEDPRMRNGLAIADYNLGNFMALQGRMPEAAARYEGALRLKPDLPEAQLNWGNALVAEGRPEDAIAHYRAALRLRPNYPEAQYILRVTLLRTANRGRPSP